MLLLRSHEPDYVLVANAKHVANQYTFDGTGNPQSRYVLQRCTHVDPCSGTAVMFTRDTNHHVSGWWKNPMYERCYHLSLSYRDVQTGQFAPHDHRLSEKWLKAFFGSDVRWVWCEPPTSRQGKATDTWHFRLFCDEGWQPHKPQGEVYSRELTEAGWLSFSDRQAQLEMEQQRIVSP